MALSLKQKLFDYFAQRHFDLMTPEVRARFDDYAKNEDFQGDMKDWNDNYKGAFLPDLKGTPGGTDPHQLTDDEWGELFDAFQEAFQAMDNLKDPSFGRKGPYKKPTNDFIAKWFGDYTVGKAFIKKEATATAEDILTTGTDNLANFLTANPSLKDTFKNNLKETFSDISYGQFIQGLRNKTYNSDTKFREKVFDVIRYINDYGPQEGYSAPSRSQWPIGVGYTPHSNGDGTFSVTPGTVAPVINNVYANPDTDKWFEIPRARRDVCINRFKDNYAEIFDTLVDKKNIRSDFLAQMRNSAVSESLTEAIKQTSYDDKESDNYIPPKYPDEKNWRQELEDWKNNTYEDYFRKFVNPSRGTRIYFSPWSQNIIKAFDKAKIKPTDGLEGILKNKDAISGNLKSSATSGKHFKWFADTIEKLKGAGMGKAVEGALRNGAQMRQLVSAVIAEAVEQDKIKEAKTALEVLSVAKYGLLSSRTLDAIRKADMTIFSDGKLSWNKNEGIKTVTGAIDKTARAAVVGISAGIVGINNFIQHRRTKIGNDIRNNPILKKAHAHWNEEDSMKTVDDKLADLAKGEGKSGHIIRDAATLAAAVAAHAALPAGPDKDNLEADINAYNALQANKGGIQARQAARATDPNSDKFRELISYWDMLESVGKSHSFTLGSMSAKRKAMLTVNPTLRKSPAQRIIEDSLYSTLRTA